jgi:hypothetical protein
VTCSPASGPEVRIPVGQGPNKQILGPTRSPNGCGLRAADFPAAAPVLSILGMNMIQIILLIALIALIAFWFFMRKKGA